MRPRSNAPAPVAPRFDLSIVNDIVGTYTDAQQASNAIARCQQIGHLVSPVTVVPHLPPGVGVGVSAVLLNPQRDAYTPFGTSLLAPTKRGIDLIAGAAGVEWDPLGTGIVHQERDRIVFTCAGSYKTLDGRDRPILGTKDMDVRDGGPVVLSMHETCVRKHAREHGRDCTRECAERSGHEAAQNQIRILRTHLLSHAETKAGLRAVRRAFSLRAAYRPEELDKPFLVVQAVWTGRSEDPALARLFAEKTADRFLGAKERMYGPVQRAQVIDVRTTEEIAADARGEDDDGPRGGVVPPAGAPTSPKEASTPPAAQRPAAPPPRQPAPAQAPPAGGQGPATSSTMRLPKKGGGGDLLKDATEKDLMWWRDKIAEGLESGTTDPRWQKRNEDLVDAIDAELDFRGPAEGTIDPEDIPW